MNRIYLDHNATSPVRAEVWRTLEEMGVLGNPASVHAEGRRARALLDEARARVASWAGVSPDGVVFTSGGTEANALAVHALTRWAQREELPARAALSAGSHPSLRENVEAVFGWRSEEFTARTLDDADAPSLPLHASTWYDMAAHNETGEIFDLGPTIDAARRAHGKIHVDAVQSPGKTVFDPRLRDADMFTISGHKIGGLMGAGALILPRPFEFEPLIHGGGQEFGRRSGTPSLAAIISLGLALTLNFSRDLLRALAIRLRDGLRARLDTWQVELSCCEVGLPGTLLISFPEVPGDLMAAALDRNGVAASYGSACSSGEQEPSRALLGLGIPIEMARSAIRFSLGPGNTVEEVNEAVERIARAFTQVKEAL